MHHEGALQFAFKLQFSRRNSTQKHRFWKKSQIIKIASFEGSITAFLKKTYKSSYDNNHFVVFWSYGKEWSDLIFFGRLLTSAKWSAKSYVEKMNKKTFSFYFDRSSKLVLFEKYFDLDRIFLIRSKFRSKIVFYRLFSVIILFW